MTLLTVAQRGEAILSVVATPVSEQDFNSPWLSTLTDAMTATMLARQGVGIAAPQIYVSKRVIIVASRPNPRYPDAPEMEAVLMLNPEIIYFSEEDVLGEEGCLSVPNQRAQVLRAQHIRVRYCSLAGGVYEADYSGFVARIVQHEIDHLNGILFVDKV